MVDEVRERLTAWIHSGRLKVDAQLPSENELARIFGVSRPVIREALVGLQALGITVPRTGKGTFVASGQVKPELLLGGYGAEHLTEVRRLLEVPAARLAAERRNSQDLARMTALLRAMAEQGDARQRNKLDAEFHIAIAATSGNPLLAKLVGDLRAVLEQVSFLASYLTYRRDSAQAEHQAIFDAISQREAGRAEAAMSAHLSAIDKSMAAIRRRLMRQQDEPEARQRTTAVGAPVAPKNDETKRNRTQTTPRVGKEAKNAK
jgi:DNA-binding FadR family transcriptional regulator